MSHPVKFAVKWNNKIYKSICISRSKNKSCIILSLPKGKSHTTYPKDGNIHETTRYPKKPDKEPLEEHDSVTGIRIVRKENGNCIEARIYSWKMPSFDELKTARSIATYATILPANCSNITECKKYEVVDLDAFNCENPNTFTYIAPSNYDIRQIPETHKGETRIVMFDDVWIVLRFIDSFQPIKSSTT